MGRIGKLPIVIPAQVKITVNEDSVKVEGPKGVLELKIPLLINVLIEDNQIKVTSEEENDALRGTIRALINNMVIGVTEGYSKSLLIEGQGYRASLEGKDLNLQIGYPNIIKFNPPAGIRIEVPAPQRIVVYGIDKQLVGDVAAAIRVIRKPDPYKGKGIRYEGEFIRRKAGKKAGYGATGT